jgi:hypothetical protein
VAIRSPSTCSAQSISATDPPSPWFEEHHLLERYRMAAAAISHGRTSSEDDGLVLGEITLLGNWVSGQRPSSCWLC